MIYEVIKTKSKLAKELVTTRELRGNEYRIYEFLLKNADNKTGETMWNVGAIAYYTCVHPSTVRRTLKRLTEKGKILVQHRKNAFNNENTSNIYTICDMLSDDALSVKRMYIEEYPTIVDRVDVAEDLVREMFAKLNTTATEEVVEEEILEVEEVVSEVSDLVETIKADLFDTANCEVDQLVRDAGKIGITMTVQQASRINSIYTPSMIKNALVQCKLNNSLTYFELDKTLKKLNSEKEKIMELRFDFKKVV